MTAGGLKLSTNGAAVVQHIRVRDWVTVHGPRVWNKPHYDELFPVLLSKDS